MLNFAQKTARYFFAKIAERIQKNHLFEQPHERIPHPPLRFEKPRTDEKVYFSSIEEISNDIHSHSGWCLVHHWATWCDGCMEEIDEIERFASILKEEGIAVVGISWELFNGTPPQHALPVVQHVHVAHSLNFESKVIKGNPEEFFDKLGLKEHQIPQTALYENGTCMYSHLGILTKVEQEKIHTIIQRGENE
ncbi:MAG: hypothetical protein CL916_13640 [Deltaproteobacteria bacterium]|nr:hypothetical protein [Deltaproteobacteria bacterium]